MGVLRILTLLLPIAADAVLELSLELGKPEEYQSKYTWVLALGIIGGFFMAWGIGANDVANSFATSVSSKALTLKQAVMIAAVCEFLGCLVLGAAVTDTVKSGIVDGNFFKGNPEVLQIAMLCALWGAGFWLLLCSALGSPVSTTHSIIGALVGVSLCVNPESLNTEQLGLVVLSWLTSPLLSGIVAAVVYSLCRCFILRSPDSVARGFRCFPFLIFITYFIIIMYVTFKNPQLEIKDWVSKYPGFGFLIALGISLFLSAVTFAALYSRVKKGISEVDEVAVQDEAAVEPGSALEAGKVAVGVDEKTGGLQGMFFGKDLQKEAEAEDDTARALGAEAEVFPPKTEALFSYLQVVSACFDSLAHGANDVANAVGPIAAIVAIHETAKVDSKVEVPIWILAMGGAGIVIGLFTYGYNVIKSIGMKLSKITPCRGFSIEMGSSVVVIIGSNLGIPLSTTHCQVGATVGVGMCEIKGSSSVFKGVNWRLLLKVGLMWIFTLIFAGFFSAALFSFITASYHPMAKPLPCGPIAGRLNNTASMLSLTQDVMKARFKALDANSDKKLNSDELKAFGLDTNIKGDKKTVETYGRRRRRTPTTMDEKDFLQYTCVKSPALEHMSDKICEPQCQDGYRANKELECKQFPTTTSPEGDYLLGTAMSGFKTCQANK